jgi:hypothetical protein
MSSPVEVFDIHKPNTWPTKLNLKNVYDRIVMQQLLSYAHQYAVASENAFDQKSCFYGAKLNGKPTWNPPTEKTPQDLWDFGENPDGILTFNFTIDPVMFKKDMVRLAREAATQNQN